MMLTSALVSFGHFLAFFTISAALVVQLVLLSETMSCERARRIRRASMMYALAMILIAVFGSLRVLYFEKGVEYYFSNGFFIAKISVFLLIALLHAIPAVQFSAWRHCIQRGETPELSASQIRKLRLIIHSELAGIGIILLCAAFMAKGIDNF